MPVRLAGDRLLLLVLPHDLSTPGWCRGSQSRIQHLGAGPSALCCGTHCCHQLEPCLVGRHTCPQPAGAQTDRMQVTAEPVAQPSGSCFRAYPYTDSDPILAQTQPLGLSLVPRDPGDLWSL